MPRKKEFKVERYYHTEWMDETELPLRLEGPTLDAVYENFIRQIAGNNLGSEEKFTAKESIGRQKQWEQLEKQIAVLEARIRKEKQPKIKFELLQQIKALKGELMSP